jgi:HSP20 family molecular chaperone IbpA
MKVSFCFRRTAIVSFILLGAKCFVARKLRESDEDADTIGKEIIPKSTYNEAESILNEALREMFQDFSSHMTVLHDLMFFSRRRFPSLEGSRSYSSWDPFSIAGAAQSVTRWSPRYEVIDDESSFEIKVDVAGFHFHELSVELESGGRVLCISGTKEEDAEDWGDEDKGADESKEPAKEDKESVKFISHTSRSFQQKFTLDPSIDSKKMSANLDPNHGALVIRAPRKVVELEYKRHIPITQVRYKLSHCHNFCNN